MASTKAASFPQSSNEEVISHYGAVRLRAKGNANLQLILYSFDNYQSFVAAPIVLSAATNIEPNRLTNFTQQRAKLRIQTTNLNETFQISKIVIFTKPVAKSFPE